MESFLCSAGRRMGSVRVCAFSLGIVSWRLWGRRTVSKSGKGERSAQRGGERENHRVFVFFFNGLSSVTLTCSVLHAQLYKVEFVLCFVEESLDIDTKTADFVALDFALLASLH